jgi:asparagine synthase (glutamine-hydrolysing)
LGALYGEIYTDWQTQVDPREIVRATATLKHRGQGGATQRLAPGAALVWLNAGTPNDALIDGQPWVDRDLWIAFDGALHNRAVLCEEFKLPAQTRLLALLVNGWRRLGVKLAARLEGNFALVVVDFVQHKVLLARDPLGARALHYRWISPTANTSASLRFASEEHALARLEEINARANGVAIAEYFAHVRAPVGQTFFHDVQTLPAGATAVLFDSKLVLTEHNFYVPTAIKKITTRDAVLEFRALLDASVAAHLPSAGRLGVSLSGGLDSNALFATSADALQAHQLCALSWRFDALKGCDEAEIAAQHGAERGIECVQFGADALHVFCQPTLRPVSLNTPRSNIYRELKSALYARAQRAGARTVFNGAFGDHLFIDANEWFSDAIARRDFAPMLTEIFWRLKRDPRLWRDASVRRMLRRALGLGAGAQTPAQAELTSFAKSQLAALRGASQRDGLAIRARQLELCLDSGAQFAASGEAEFAERFGIDLSTPYRHPALLRFMLSLPVHLTHRQGQSKWILREAMRARMPETIRTRPKSTSLQPFFDAALTGPAHAQAKDLLLTANADWPRFYDRSMIVALLASANRTDSQSAKLWTCLGYELWRTAHGWR